MCRSAAAHEPTSSQSNCAGTVHALSARSITEKSMLIFSICGYSLSAAAENPESGAAEISRRILPVSGAFFSIAARIAEVFQTNIPAFQ